MASNRSSPSCRDSVHVLLVAILIRLLSKHHMTISNWLISYVPSHDGYDCLLWVTLTHELALHPLLVIRPSVVVFKSGHVK